MLRRILIVLIPLVLVSACAAPPPVQTLRSDLNPETDFRLFKTFRWFDGPFVPDDPATADEQQYRTVHDAINTLLRDKNYDWQQFSVTDLVIHIHSGMKNAGRIENWMTYNWYQPWWGAYGPMVNVSSFAPGTLVIDIIEAKRAGLVWRGLIPAFYAEDGDLQDADGFTLPLKEVLNSLPAAIR
jgi:hypothetical protein